MTKPIIIKNNKNVNVFTDACNIDQAVVYKSDDATVSVPSATSKRYSPGTGRTWFEEWYYNDRTFTSLADEYGVNLNTMINRCHKAGFYFMQERVKELEESNEDLLEDNLRANARIKELSAQVKKLQEQLEECENAKCDNCGDTFGC